VHIENTFKIIWHRLDLWTVTKTTLTTVHVALWSFVASYLESLLQLICQH
jgi:hypothetical protein